MKDNINCGILIIITLVKINSGLIFVLLRGISEGAEIFNTYNKIGINVGIRSGSTGGKINYSISIKNGVKLIKS